MPAMQWRRPGAEFWGDGKFFRGPRFLNDVFSEKISNFTAKISDDLFLVIDQVFRIFPFFSQIFPLFTMLDVVYDPFLTRKTTLFQKELLYDTFFYSVRTFTHIRQHYFSKYWGVRMHGPSPTSNFWGDRHPSPPYVSAPGSSCLFGMVLCNAQYVHVKISCPRAIVMHKELRIICVTTGYIYIYIQCIYIYIYIIYIYSFIRQADKPQHVTQSNFMKW